MIRFVVLNDEPLGREICFVNADHYVVTHHEEVERRRLSFLAFGMISLEVDSESGAVVGLSGYCPLSQASRKLLGYDIGGDLALHRGVALDLPSIDPPLLVGETVTLTPHECPPFRWEEMLHWELSLGFRDRTLVEPVSGLFLSLDSLTGELCAVAARIDGLH